jgi:hypothetical protein
MKVVKFAFMTGSVFQNNDQCPNDLFFSDALGTYTFRAIRIKLYTYMCTQMMYMYALCSQLIAIFFEDLLIKYFSSHE